MYVITLFGRIKRRCIVLHNKIDHVQYAIFPIEWSNKRPLNIHKKKQLNRSRLTNQRIFKKRYFYSTC